MRKIAALVIISLFLAVPAWAENGFREEGKQVGEGFKTMTHETGRAFKGGKRSARASRRWGKKPTMRQRKRGAA